MRANAQANNVDIRFFKINPTQHTIFLLLEAEDYSDIEKTIGQCKKTGDFEVTPVIEPPFSKVYQSYLSLPLVMACPIGARCLY